MEYQLIRSSRRTVAIQIEPDGSVLVRAPKRCSKAMIEGFVQEKKAWIVRKQAEVLERARRQQESVRQQPALDEADYRRYQAQAAQLIRQKVAAYAARMQVDYGRITIRDQRTRWGSCSAKGNLNFNWRLILAPEEVLDYVVVHELAHRREMNHSSRFWNQVEAVLPDYRECRIWLRQNGAMLMQR